MESPYETGQLIGGMLWLLVAGAAIAKCVQVLRRPTSEPRCVTALLLVTVVWLLGALKTLAKFALDVDERWLTLALGIVVLPLLFGAFVLAIVGLASYDGERHRQGKAQAIWALVISVIYGLIGLASAALVLSKRAGAAPGAVAGARARPELGYTLGLGELGWAEWPDVGNEVPLADFGALRTNEGLAVCSVVIDTAPPALEELAAGLLSQLDFEYPAGGRFRTRDWSPFPDGEGLEIETERSVNGAPMRYLMRVARGTQSAHFLAGWAWREGGDMAELRKALERVTLAPPRGRAPAPTEAQRVARGEVWNRAALAYFAAGDYAAARPWFERGFAEADDPVMLDNLASTLELLDEVDEALERVSHARERFPRAHELGLRQARLFLLAGRAEEAATAAIALAKAGFRDEDAYAELLYRFGDEEELEHGVRAGEAWPAREGSMAVPRALAYLHYLADELERAQAILGPLHAAHPDLIELTYDLANVQSALGDHASVAELLEPLLADDATDTTALTILGWSQLARDWPREAKATFERAAELAPEDEEIADGLRQASAALGQGDNSDVKTPLAAVEPPEELVRALEALPALVQPEEPALMQLRMTGYHFVPGEPLRRTHTFRVRAQNAAGAEQWSTIDFSFDPLSERVFLDRAEVRDARGELVAQASLADAYVTSVDEDDMADDESQLTLPVPGMKAGCTLEWRVTVEERAPADEFRFQRHLLALGIRGERDAVFVTGALAEVRHVLTRGERVQALQGDDFRAWILADPASFVPEPQPAWAERHLPMLYLGGGTATWAERAREYLSELAGLLEPDPAARALARELTANVSDERGKIAVLARHVQRELRYEAIEFGVRGQRPNAAAETLRLRYGDCKDHALLLVQLLAGAGIESHLALVDTGWSLAPELPSLDQFDHMVVHVPALGAERLVDPTDKFLDLVAYPPDGLWEAQALVLDPAAPRLLAAPVRRAEDFRIESQRVLTVRGREVEVEETLTLHGTFSSWMRYLFSWQRPAEQRQLAQELLADDGSVRLKEFAFENRAALEQPAVLVLRYVLPAGVSADGARRSLELPAVFERMFLGTDFLAERRTPFEALEPTGFTSTVRVRLPAAPEADTLRAFTRAERDDFCAWSLAAEPGAEPGELALRFQLEAVPGQHPAARWADYHAAFEAALEAWSAPLTWRAE